MLSQAGFVFEVLPADIDESVIPGEPPTTYVTRVAREKCAAISATLDAARSNAAVLAADTTIDLHGLILGKPTSYVDALAMLEQLAGTTHQVHTATAARHGDREVYVLTSTAVTFRNCSTAELEEYLERGESLDKAGAYAIQGAGAQLVSGYVGELDTVIGLNIDLVHSLLNQLLPSEDLRNLPG